MIYTKNVIFCTGRDEKMWKFRDNTVFGVSQLKKIEKIFFMHGCSRGVVKTTKNLRFSQFSSNSGKSKF